MPLTITGPASWNDGKPLNASIPAGSRFVARRLVPVNAVAGTYTLQARIGGQTQTARATLDPSSTLPAPGGIVASGVWGAQVSASGNAVPGSNSYTLELFD